MGQITIENLKNGEKSEIDEALWNEKKTQYQKIFRVVSKPATPPEVKEMQEKQSASTEVKKVHPIQADEPEDDDLE